MVFDNRSRGGADFAKIVGTPAIGEVLTVIPNENITYSSLKWVRNGAYIDGATSESYTLTNDDNGKTIFCELSGLAYKTQQLTLETVYIYPTPVNNKFIVFGDSRTVNTTETYVGFESHVAKRLIAVGHAAWGQCYTGNTGQCIGNYGINTARISNLIARLHGSGSLTDFKGTSVSDPERGWVLDAGAGLEAGTFVLLIGVNGGNPDTGTTDSDGRTKREQYDDLFKQIVDAGKVLVVINEIPSWGTAKDQNTHYDLHQYLNTWPNSSPRLTALEKEYLAEKTIIVNAYDLLGDPANPKAPFAPFYGTGDVLHPTTAGNRLIGKAYGLELKTMYERAGFLPTPLPVKTDNRYHFSWMDNTPTAIPATNNETAGAGGANMDGRGGVSVTGMLPSGYKISRSSLSTFNGTQDSQNQYYLNVTTSIVTDSDGFPAIRVAVKGFFPSTTSSHNVTLFQAPQYLNKTSLAAKGLVDGDKLFGICKIKLDDNHKGVTGAGLFIYTSFVGNPDTGHYTLSAPLYSTAGTLDSTPEGFELPVKTASRTIPTGALAASGTTTFDGRIMMQFAGMRDVDAVFTISRLALVKE